MLTSCEIREHLNGMHATGDQGPGTGDQDAATASPDDADPSLATGSVLMQVGAPTVLELLELILKDRPRLERIIHDPSLSAELLPRLLAIALIAITLLGATLAT